MRVKPSDPAYDIESISFKDKVTKEHIVITPENFEDLKEKIFDHTSIQMKAKVSLRPPSPLKGRGRRDSQNDENNAPCNYSSTQSPSEFLLSIFQSYGEN